MAYPLPRLEVCVHEAGHAVAAATLGTPIFKLIINRRFLAREPDDTQPREAEHAPIAVIVDGWLDEKVPTSDALRQLIIAWGGIAAQCRFNLIGQRQLGR